MKLFELDSIPPRYVLDTLALGPKNAILDKFNPKDTLAEIDMLLSKCKRNKLSNDIINEINVATFKYVKSCSNQKSPRNLLLTKKYLKEHELVAIPFDKGVGLCIMKKTTYKEKLDDILKLDQFVKLEKPRKNSKDFIIKEEERINDELVSLRDEGKITEELMKELKSIGGQPPRLYGLAKVHKTVVPTRPVLSMPGSPYHNIAVKVTNWLSAIPESKNQCSSKKIADQLKDIALEEEEILISFDVVSLYTNVPVLEAIQVAADRLYCGEFETPPVDKNTFIALLKLACTNIIMSTHDGYYCQKDGLAMGSPPAPLLANIWLKKREPVIRDDAKLFERYMDDIIRSIRADAVEEKLKQINGLHGNLKFTMELEQEGKIPFLDMLLIRKNNKITSTWYCKPTDTGLVMNFHALAPKRYKKSVVSGFVHRIFRACSSWILFTESLEKAKSILEKNQYPPQFYDPIIEETIVKLSQQNVVTEEKKEEVQQKHMVILQYRGTTTDQFVKQLNRCGAPVQVILTLRKLKTFLPSLKPIVPQLLKSRVIYKIDCPRCHACYVGKTCRHLQTRFGEHKTKKSQPVYKHFRECGVGKACVDNIEVLTTVIKGGVLLSTMEALFIREISPGINTRDEFRDHELTIKI